MIGDLKDTTPGHPPDACAACDADDTEHDGQDDPRPRRPAFVVDGAIDVVRASARGDDGAFGESARVVCDEVVALRAQVVKLEDQIVTGANAAALVVALGEGRIVAKIRSEGGKVAIRFVDLHGHQATVTPDDETPALPRAMVGFDAQGREEPKPSAPPELAPEDMNESRLKTILIKLLEEEHGRKTGGPLRDRIIARALAVVGPVSASPGQARTKAEWLADKTVPVLERRRWMTREDFALLVDELAGGSGMRG